MAKFSQQFLQAMAQPSYQQGLFTAARELGGLRGRLDEERRQAELKKQEEEKLAKQRQYQANLLSLGASGTFDPEMLKGALGGATELGMSPAVAAQAIQAGQGFRPKPRLTVDQKEKLLENFTVESIANYERTGDTAAFVRRQTPPDYVFETKNVTDPKSGITNIIRFAYDKNSSNPSVPAFENVIGRAPSDGGADATKSISQMLADKGFEADLSTDDGIRAARNFALIELQNASLGKELGQMLEDRQPLGLADSFKLLEVDPAVATARTDLFDIEKYRALEQITEADVAGLTSLKERLLTNLAPNDVKAVQELGRFRSDDEVVDLIRKFTTRVFVGGLDKETRSEYNQIIDVLEAASKNRIINSARRMMLVTPSDKEQKALQNIIDVYGGNTARVVD
jgi:hypothetical protein